MNRVRFLLLCRELQLQPRLELGLGRMEPRVYAAQTALKVGCQVLAMLIKVVGLA